MKVVILAGGRGSRMEEATDLKPKPMIEIGELPILWHIMKLYSHYNLNDFVICCGYKGYEIKEFFANYELHASNVTIDIQKKDIEIHQKNKDWQSKSSQCDLYKVEKVKMKKSLSSLPQPL